MNSLVSQRAILLVMFLAALSGCVGRKPKDVSLEVRAPVPVQYTPKVVCLEPYNKLCRAVRHISANYYLPLEQERVIDLFIQGGKKRAGVGFIETNGKQSACEGVYDRLCGAVRAVAQQSVLSEHDVVEAFLEGGMEELNLDPYSFYKKPLRKGTNRGGKVLSNGIANARSYGIGVSLRQKEDQVVVRSVIPELEADIGGIQSGDIITHVDDVSMNGRNRCEAGRRIKGALGTKVRITIARECTGFPRTLTLTRWPIPPTTAREAMTLPGNYGYLDIPHFKLGDAKFAKKELLRLVRRIHLKGLILDVRGNPGGNIGEAIQFVSFFIKEGAVVHRHFRSRKTVPHVTGAD
ncbi:MAG: S41 family peptidase, partial [Nitrososphaera sp.]|nr:S41 family peptidase [Nitrososphaera sp.]